MAQAQQPTVLQFPATDLFFAVNGTRITPTMVDENSGGGAQLSLAPGQELIL